MKPITPQELDKGKSVPDFVIASFNRLINEKWVATEAIIRQDDVVREILSRAPEGTTREIVFANGWLNIEDIYRKVGWIVTYDKPAYCETYPATFTFQKKQWRR